jgi:hypothetical protein
MKLAIFAMLALLAACASAPETADTAALSCAAPSGIDAVLDRKERYLVFGELHGTEQTPATFAEIVCAAARRGPVIVGVEWDESQATLMNAYVRSGASADLAARDRLADEIASFDGRGSRAGIAMFDRFRELSAKGAKLTIVPFSRSDKDPPGVQDDASYAQALREGAGSEGRVLVLVGNAHAMRKEMTFSTVRVIPMASHLVGDGVLSFNIAHAGGEHWGCINMRCRPSRAAAQPGPEGVTINPAVSDQYDGQWNVGRLTASPPAVEITLPPDSPFKIG